MTDLSGSLLQVRKVKFYKPVRITVEHENEIHTIRKSVDSLCRTRQRPRRILISPFPNPQCSRCWIYRLDGLLCIPRGSTLHSRRHADIDIHPQADIAPHAHVRTLCIVPMSHELCRPSTYTRSDTTHRLFAIPWCIYWDVTRDALALRTKMFRGFMQEGGCEGCKDYAVGIELEKTLA